MELPSYLTSSMPRTYPGPLLDPRSSASGRLRGEFENVYQAFNCAHQTPANLRGQPAHLSAFSWCHQAGAVGAGRSRYGCTTSMYVGGLVAGRFKVSARPADPRAVATSRR